MHGFRILSATLLISEILAANIQDRDNANSKVCVNY